MSIRAIMDKIVVIQKNLSISDPKALSVKKVWKFVPPQDKTLTDLPCWMNHLHLNNTIWDPGNMREVDWSVNMMLAVAESTAQQDVSVDASAAFLEEALTAFRADHMLGGADRIQNLRGEGPTIIPMTWGRKTYIGLNLFLDIKVIESNG